MNHIPLNRSSRLITWLSCLLIIRCAGGNDLQAQVPAPAPTLDDLTPDERVNVSVYEKANRSVVNISIRVRQDPLLFAPRGQKGNGSGCVLDRKGHVITNNHVIKDVANSRSGAILVTLYDGTPYAAEIVGRDPPNDIAVLKIDAPSSKLQPIELGDSSNLRVGLRVFVIGSPFGFDRTMTTGIISSLNRTLPVSEVRSIKGVIQTDAAINPGNSGGPLLDKYGRLIGVNTAIVSPVGQSSGIGFSIPVNNIKRVVPQLLEFGRVIRADIGVLTVYEEEGVPGILLWRLERGGPAAEAGMRGPRVVVRRQGFYEFRTVDPETADRVMAVDGESVNGFDDLLAIVESKKPGDTVKVTFERGGKLFEVPVRLRQSE